MNKKPSLEDRRIAYAKASLADLPEPIHETAVMVAVGAAVARASDHPLMEKFRTNDVEELKAAVAACGE